MYMYEYIMNSKRPEQITTYDTIVYPFDAYIWIFITISMIAQFLALFIMQNVWSISSGASNPKDYIFQGSNQPIHIMPWNIKLLYYFSDVFLSTIMIPKRRQISWINRQGFVTRKRIILQWLLLGHFLTLSYKSTLLSTLIPIRYESAIDTLQDMAESGLPFTVPRATTIHKLIATDPRPSMKSIYKRSYFVPVVVNSTTGKRLQNM